MVTVMAEKPSNVPSLKTSPYFTVGKGSGYVGRNTPAKLSPTLHISKRQIKRIYQQFYFLIVTLQVFVWWCGAKRLCANRLATLKTRKDQILMFFSHSVPFSSQSIGYRSTVLKRVKYLHSINQTHLFWLLDVKHFSIFFPKYIPFYFTFRNQNNRTWLIKCTCFTC